jgi:hypothetical protein
MGPFFPYVFESLRLIRIKGTMVSIYPSKKKGCVSGTGGNKYLQHVEKPRRSQIINKKINDFLYLSLLGNSSGYGDTLSYSTIYDVQ